MELDTSEEFILNKTDMFFNRKQMEVTFQLPTVSQLDRLSI